MLTRHCAHPFALLQGLSQGHPDTPRYRLLNTSIKLSIADFKTGETYQPVQPASAQQALHQLSSLAAPDMPIEVTIGKGYDYASSMFGHEGDEAWTPDLLKAVLIASGELPQLHITLQVLSLHDWMLELLMQHGSAIKGVAGEVLRLTDARYGGVRRQWGTLTMSRVSTGLHCVPLPQEGGRLLEGVSMLSLRESDQVCELGLGRVREWAGAWAREWAGG